MDKTMIILLIILILVAGIFIGFQISSGDSSTAATAYAANSFPTQYGGGGCGLG
ncbi:hypothetical protein J4229_02480 [Candidatus Pacearchaeota archaeon]|nr:hypothetical protein [Candidatus Pacearchaeota archaeon]